MSSLRGWSDYLIVYNALAVKSDQILQPKLVPEIDQAFEELDIEQAKTLCESNPGPLTNIIQAGLSRTDISDYDMVTNKHSLKSYSNNEVTIHPNLVKTEAF